MDGRKANVYISSVWDKLLEAPSFNGSASEG